MHRGRVVYYIADLYTKGLNVVGAIGSACEVRQVKLDLVPAIIQTHWHSTYEWFHTGCGLIVRGSKPSADILIIQHLHLEGEVLLQVLDNHDQEGQFDAQRLAGISRARDECSAGRLKARGKKCEGMRGQVAAGSPHIGAHNFKDQ